jgi:hypothetical protein
MTKAEILAGLRRCAKKLGRTPTKAEIKRMTKITEYFIHMHFVNLAHALKAAGVPARGVGHRVETAALLQDWAHLARKLGRPPSFMEYRRQGHYGANSILNRCGAWSRVGERFRALMEENKTEREWADVLKMIARWEGHTTAEGRRKLLADAHVSERQGHDEPLARQKIKRDRPVYGPPLNMRGMRYEPTCESGVMFAFGRVADKLGFEVERIQVGYPDLEAMREVAAGKWQRVKMEVELYSRNFVEHGHALGGCDILLCWIHNWPECPEEIEVIELSKMFRRTR